MSPSQNDEIAARLDEISAILAAQSANPFRVRAYRQAADTLRRLAVPVSRILETQGAERPRSTARHRPEPRPDHPRHRRARLFAKISSGCAVKRPRPALRVRAGHRSAARGPRLHDEIGLDTLRQLEAAAYDGRLEQIAGFGPKRLGGIRDTLARRFGSARPEGRASDGTEIPPAVDELLDVDHEYREKANAGQLPRIAPRRFNPEKAAWLSILHTERGGRHYTALFSNTARAHRLGRVDDWVVVYCDDGAREHQWTIITAAFGPLEGRRIVRGREAECVRFYGVTTPVVANRRGPNPAFAGHGTCTHL